ERAALVPPALQPNVMFVGEVANPYPMVAALDIFCLTSRADPFPLVVLEAMALQRPVVAFDVGGVARQLGDAGTLVERENVGEMADAVVDLLKDERERKRLGDAGLSRVRANFDRRAFSARIVVVVSSALETQDPAKRPRIGRKTLFWGATSAPESASAFMLHAFPPSSLDRVRSGWTAQLPYRAELLAEEGVSLRLSDAMYR